MICPGCQKSQPMAHRCKSCGTELMRGRFEAASGDAGATEVSSAFGPPLPALAGAGASAGTSPHNPYATPGAIRARERETSRGNALAPRGARLAAALIDTVLAFLLVIPIVATAAFSASGNETSAAFTFMLIGSFVAFGAFVVYQIWILVRDGQTIGKRIMKIRIVDYESGEVPSAGKMLGMRYLVNGLLGNIPFYPIIDHLLIFGEEQRCIHDHLAGTKVVDA